MIYLFAFLATFAISFLLTPLVRMLALKYNIVDHPDGVRKMHKWPIAYLGGVAIYTAFLISVVAFLPVGRQLGALLLGATILVIVGVYDDIRGIRAVYKLGWQILAACVVLAGGIGISTISNPFGGIIDLSWGRMAFDFMGFEFHITPIANLISIIWIVGMINVVNFLDGLDGLASGVSAIAAIIIFALSISPDVNQPVVALLAIILAGASLGFLPFNFFPARIFMGDAGAYFLGLTLALLAIYSGGKLATAGLVLGFAIIDSIWTIIRRLRRKTHPFTADREHLHHLLIAAGLSQRTAVLLLYALSIIFGAVALVSSSSSKVLAFTALFALVIVMISALVRLGQKQS